MKLTYERHRKPIGLAYAILAALTAVSAILHH